MSIGFRHSSTRKTFSLALIVWGLVLTAGCFDPVTIPPGAAEFRYVGRFDFSDSLRPKFDWPGSYIEAVFEGTSVGVYLHGGFNNFNVFIDGRLVEVIRLETRIDSSFVVWQDTTDTLGAWTRFPPDDRIVDSLLTFTSFRPDTVSTDSLRSWNRTFYPDSLILVDSLHAVVVSEPDTFFQIATNLPDTQHTIRITKRTEGVFGVTTFGGLRLDRGKRLAPLPPEPQRKMLFLGDSFVAGYGNEGLDPSCSFSRDTQNSYLAYGSMLSRRFRASYMLIAKSGAGIVRNFGEPSARSPDPFPVYARRRLMNEPWSRWNPTEWQPDMILIRLGNNDFYGRPYPSRRDFRLAYGNFVDQLRMAYPEAHIAAICGPTSKGFYCPNIERVVNERSVSAADKKIHYIRLEPNLVRPDDFGCDWHPSISGHRKIADALEPHIRGIMNW